MKLKEILKVLNTNACYLVGNKALMDAENNPVTKVSDSVNIKDFICINYKQLETMPNVQVLEVGAVHGVEDSVIRLTLDIDDKSLGVYAQP